MTKIKTIYLWGLLLLFSVYSCRTDFVQEQQNIEDVKAYALTQKIISLSQSKHKQKLLGELDESKKLINKNFKKQNIFAKNVSFGDSISIDTDHVIYIENENYHTYTFKIDRNNPSPNDPIENLLLTPLPDGTYKEFLVSYNLTQQEKEILKNGGNINKEGKVTVTELQNNFQGNILGRYTETNCTWETLTVTFPCLDPGGAAHLPGQTCNMPEGYRAFTYDIVALVCQDVPLGPVHETLVPSPGGGGPVPCNGDCPDNNDDCRTAASNPGEVGLVDGNGCLVGSPTDINFGDNDSPCEEIKKITDETTDLYNKIINLKKTDTLDLDHEKGAIVIENASGQTQLTPKNGTPGTKFIVFEVPENGELIIFVHTHFDAPDMLPTFTFEDLMSFNAMFQWRKYNNKSIDKLAYYVITKSGVFVMRVENESLFETEGYKLWTDEQKDLNEKFYGDLTEKVNISSDEVTKQVAKSLPKFGVGLYKANSDLTEWKKIEVNETTDELEENPCN